MGLPLVGKFYPHFKFFKFCLGRKAAAFALTLKGVRVWILTLFLLGGKALRVCTQIAKSSCEFCIFRHEIFLCHFLHLHLSSSLSNFSLCRFVKIFKVSKKNRTVLLDCFYACLQISLTMGTYTYACTFKPLHQISNYKWISTTQLPTLFILLLKKK